MGALKMQDRKIRGGKCRTKVRSKNSGLENAGLEYRNEKRRTEKTETKCRDNKRYIL